MKKFLFPLLAICALTVGTAAAQTPTTSPDAGAMQGRGRMQGNPDEMAKRQADRMTQELGLNADQTAKVQQILLARGQEMQAMRGQARDAGNRDQMREQMQAGRAKYDAQFKEVLTADQYTKYTTMQADRMNRGGGPGRDMDATDVKKMKAKSTDGDKIKVKADK
ncbi:hypothetical protein KB206_02670 [Microvirga sp. STS02]|uniref:hypothetical protein n=1 Tax=Hymenobacter negativus TaxID=2795026 RepID=UPI0018DCA494|nr:MULTISPECIES: hypothetical protein [Bacteria]MBH8567769.1 hypothetical protein [Hymenobacter negativus]MBR7207503.1 hypothetical protein [Microvirga sp. STS02]